MSRVSSKTLSSCKDVQLIVIYVFQQIAVERSLNFTNFFVLQCYNASSDEFPWRKKRVQNNSRVNQSNNGKAVYQKHMTALLYYIKHRSDGDFLRC